MHFLKCFIIKNVVLLIYLNQQPLPGCTDCSKASISKRQPEPHCQSLKIQHCITFKGLQNFWNFPLMNFPHSPLSLSLSLSLSHSLPLSLSVSVLLQSSKYKVLQGPILTLNLTLNIITNIQNNSMTRSVA